MSEDKIDMRQKLSALMDDVMKPAREAYQRYQEADKYGTMHFNGISKIPREGRWKNVHTVDLVNGQHYLIRRVFVDHLNARTSKPEALAVWLQREGWIIILGDVDMPADAGTVSRLLEVFVE